MLKLKPDDFKNHLIKKKNSHVKSYPIIKCIYKITNTLNNEFYIGYTNDFFKRSKSHINSNKSKIDTEITLLGKDNFLFEIIYDFNKSYVIENNTKYKYHIFIEQKIINELNPYYNEYKL